MNINEKSAEWLEMVSGGHPVGPVKMEVLSGSMHPAIRAGDTVVIDTSEKRRPRIGEIAVFSEKRQLTAHRVLFTLPGRIYQKGDRNSFGRFSAKKNVAGVITGIMKPDETLLELEDSGRIAAFRETLKLLYSLATEPARKFKRRLFPRPLVIQCGGIRLGLIVPGKQLHSFVADYYRGFIVPENPLFSLKINIRRRSGSFEIPDSLFNTKTVNSSTFSAGGLVYGKLCRDGKGAVISVPAGLFVKPVVRVFEQILYQAYFNAAALSDEESFLIHACGVEDDGWGYLFCGPSGSGKSTTAALSVQTRKKVLNDEICLIRRFDGRLMLSSTPFNGLFRDKYLAEVPLKAVFLIAHGATNMIEDIAESHAVKTLAREIVPPIGLTEKIGPATFTGMLDTAQKLTREIPVKRLRFRPDASFWKTISEHFS